MELSEFNPAPVMAWVDETIIFELRPFDLRAVVWAESFFSQTTKGGVDVMNQILRSDHKKKADWEIYAATVADVSYHLAKDLDDSGIFSSCEFKSKIKKAKGGPEKSIASLSLSIDNVIFNSFPQTKEEKPQMDGGAIFQHIISQQKQSDPAKTDWSKVYTTFYRAGGISINDFYSMTMKQIDHVHLEIISQNNEDLKTKSDLANAIIMRAPVKINGI